MLSNICHSNFRWYNFNFNEFLTNSPKMEIMNVHLLATITDNIINLKLWFDLILLRNRLTKFLFTMEISYQ